MPKIINERGMMFGNRINIIDFLVLIFIFSLTPCLWFGWKIFNRPPPQPPLPITTITIQTKEYEALKSQIQKQQSQSINNEEIAKFNSDILYWKQKYSEKIAQEEKVFKKHPRMRKYFK